jgi:hypothetical protein
MAESFIEKCRGLPLHPGNLQSLGSIEGHNRAGFWTYEPDQEILVTDDGMR